MSGFKIRKLIEEFTSLEDEHSYAEHMHSLTDDEYERDEWFCEMDMLMYQLYELADDIRELKPSKYMLENYDELNYILENY